MPLSLKGSTSTAAVGDPVMIGPSTHVSWQASYGGTTAISIRVQGSIDGVAWVNAGGNATTMTTANSDAGTLFTSTFAGPINQARLTVAGTDSTALSFVTGRLEGDKNRR